MKYIIGVPEVHINWIEVEADNLDLAFERADDGVDLESIEELQYSHTLERDDFKVRLPDGSEVTSEEALDLEGINERIGE